MCRPCKARRWQEKAFAKRTGEGQETPNANSDQALASAPLDIDFHVVAPGRNTSIKDRVLQYAAIRAAEPKLTNAEIAERLGIAPRTLANTLTRAVREKWLTFSDPISRVEHEIIPKTVENLIDFLDAKDRTVTIEVAKGTLFKAWQDSKGIHDGQQQTVLALRIDTVLPEGAPSQSSSLMVGKPKLPTIEILPEE